jgi:hypothetical protein
MRMAWNCTENTFGRDCGLPMMNGTPPSQTSVLSMQLIVL